MRIRSALAIALTLASAPVLAHHTAAYLYDVDKPVTLKGTVTAVGWVVELKGPMGGMNRLGIKPDFLKPGDAISMSVCAAKDGSHTAGARSIMVPGTLEDTRVGIC